MLFQTYSVTYQSTLVFFMVTHIELYPFIAPFYWSLCLWFIYGYFYLLLSSLFLLLISTLSYAPEN